MQSVSDFDCFFFNFPPTPDKEEQSKERTQRRSKADQLPTAPGGIMDVTISQFIIDEFDANCSLLDHLQDTFFESSSVPFLGFDGRRH